MEPHIYTYSSTFTVRDADAFEAEFTRDQLEVVREVDDRVWIHAHQPGRPLLPDSWPDDAAADDGLFRRVAHHLPPTEVAMFMTYLVTDEDVDAWATAVNAKGKLRHLSWSDALCQLDRSVRPARAGRRFKNRRHPNAAPPGERHIHRSRI